MKKTILILTGFAFITFNNQAQTVTDIDGNVYNIISIGSQSWLQENLKTTKYSDGTTIPNVTDSITWRSLTTGAYCDYYNNPSHSITYGRLYNWYAVADTNKICPTGWHVPGDGEWNIMEKYLDNTVDTTTTGYTGTDIGGKLKETGTTHWYTPNTGATNSSGFSGVPSGCRYFDHTCNFYTIWYYNDLWSATAFDSTTAWIRYLSYNNSQIYRSSNNKRYGFSIRCIKDPNTQINEINYQDEIKIYPNPASDRIYINCTESPVSPTGMQIYNVVGMCVLQRELNNEINEIDISSLAKGIYIIKLTGANLTIQRKLTKE